LILFYAKLIILEITGSLPEFVLISGTIQDRPVYGWEKINEVHLAQKVLYQHH